MIQHLVSFALVAFYVSQHQQFHSSTNLVAPRHSTIIHTSLQHAAFPSALVPTSHKKNIGGKKSSRKLVKPRYRNMTAERNITKILTNPALFAKDFSIILAHLESLESANVSRVAVFSDRVVIALPFRSPDAAQQLVEQLNRQITELRSKPTPLFNTMSRGVRELQVSAEVIPYFAEDRSVRVALTSPSFQLLVPGLTVEKVEKRLGKPEKITKKVIDTGGEERPLILTLYSYAGGSITFAEADIAPHPGLVDRVIINVPGVTQALINELR